MVNKNVAKEAGRAVFLFDIVKRNTISFHSREGLQTTNVGSRLRQASLLPHIKSGCCEAKGVSKIAEGTEREGARYAD